MIYHMVVDHLPGGVYGPTAVHGWDLHNLRVAHVCPNEMCIYYVVVLEHIFGGWDLYDILLIRTW